MMLLHLCVRISLHRKGFKHAASCGDELVAVLKEKALGAAPVDINHACLCETMDMIGLFGFGHEFHAVRYLLPSHYAHKERLVSLTQKRTVR